MYGRTGLDRFKKAESVEPFSVALNSVSKTASQPPPRAVYHSCTHQQPQYTLPYGQPHAFQKPAADSALPPAVSLTTPQVTQVGGGQSTWQPPDWAMEPRPGVYYLEVLKDGQVLDQINLDRRRHIFGRQFHACDFVLDHQSVSRQHAAVVPHKNGSVYVIDLGSAHGTFVANERLTKDVPVELEVGQSLRFAASTRTYVLRKNEAALFPPTPTPMEINLPPAPDPSDEEALVAYNTLLNRYGIGKSDLSRSAEIGASSPKEASQPLERAAKRMRKNRVAFRDQVGGELVEVVGVSDGADVGTEPGPLGLKEGSLVGKYESLVQIKLIPKGKVHSIKEENVSPKGVTDKLQEVLNKVKNTSSSKSTMYDDLYGECFAGKVGSSWAYSSDSSVDKESSSLKSSEEKPTGLSNVSANNNSHATDDDDDLFGD